MDVTIVEHDTKCIFTDVLKVNGVPVNLLNATIKFVMRAVGCVGVEQTAAIANPPGSDGAVKYQAVIADVARNGDFRQRWRVNFADGSSLSFPNNGYNRVRILPDLV